MSLSSATSDEMAGVEEFEFTLATTALARDCQTFDLLSMIFKQSEGILAKKNPPAAELKNPPSKHLVFEEPELDKQELVKHSDCLEWEENQEVEFDLTSPEDDSWVYYVEGLNHNIFTVGQFCDADLEATPTQAWLWHQRLSHLNFDYINLLLKKDIVIDLPKLKYVKDQLCSSCELSKAKRSSFKSKVVPSSKGRLNLLHLDLCSPMRVASINGKKYILVIVDDTQDIRGLCFYVRRINTRSVKRISHDDLKKSSSPSDYCSDGENLDKIKEKGDQCTQVGYSTQSKGYRVYNKRTRMIVESIHIRFDEIKEVSETSIANNTSGLVPQRQNALDYDNSDTVPQRQDVQVGRVYRRSWEWWRWAGKWRKWCYGGWRENRLRMNSVSFKRGGDEAGLGPNGEALRKCILSGPYKPTTVLVQAVEATDDSPAVPEHTTVETPTNMYPKNKAHFLAEKEAIRLILTRNGDDIYSTVDTCQIVQEMWEVIERSHTSTRHKGKEIAKPIMPLFETASEEDSDPEQAQRDKDMQKNLALIAKYFKKIYKPTNNNLRTSSNSKNKNVDTTPRYKNDDHSGQFGNQRTVNVARAREKVGSTVVQQSGIRCFNYKEYGHFSKECRKLNRVKDSAYHKEKMLLCKQAEQDSVTDSEPVEQVQNKAGYNVFANDLQHFDQSKSISNTCLVETDDSNIIPDLPDIKSRQAYNVMKNNINQLKQIVDDAWIKHSKDQFRAPTAQDMEILIQTCLMPLAIKTQNDSFKFVHELKQEMHADLKYVESLEKEIDELESDKAEFSDMYDKILQDCVSKDVMCSYLISLSDLDALAELQCMYLHKVKEYLKAKMQDKNIAIRELKKLIEKGKGKSVDTKFDRPSVVRQPNAQRIPKPSVLGVNHKPTVSIPQLKSIQSRDKVLPNNSQVKAKKTQVEAHPRILSVSNKMKYVTTCKDSLNSRTLNANAVCATC
nr:hypothetical protein [Tanacetum cinerariifolium]